MKLSTRIIATVALAGTAMAFTSCKREQDANATVININGSDTMLQVGLGWQAEYMKQHPEVQVAVNGEGSGVGIKALINGEITVAHSSRSIKESEIAQIKEKYGKEPVEHILGFDGIAVFCHKDNPVKEITMEQLQSIYAAGGEITKWEQINPAQTGDIKVAGRSNTSGTHVYFKEAVCGKTADGTGREFKKGILSMPGSAAVVDLCMTDKTAIGYSGMGYVSDKVGVISVSKGAGETAYEPTVENVQSKNYPIARRLYAYTVGEPEGATKAYLDWVKGPEGQAIVAKEKFVPLQ